ncbi:MAG: hypothetical protein GX234_01970 [Clostridiales bacterium]|nr:hypothetical protein [Clostridiales bacterium]
MSVNGVTDVLAANTYAASTTAKKNTEATAATSKTKEAEGVVYEKSEEATKAQKYKPKAELIAKLKADSDARTQQFRTLVEQMMGKQGITIGKADDMWKFLAGGNFTVSPEVKAQAQADIAEDGYWGVNQTSDRIIDFAKALTGGDPDKIEEMRAAFEKGFKQATGTWGKKLPEISQKTYQAVMDKFDAWAAEANGKTTVVEEQ